MIDPNRSRPTVGGVQIRNGSIDLHVAVDGDSSAPPILLLHGITASGGTWEWLVPMLAERFRVLRLDFRGHGGSGRAEGEYGLDGYASDAVAAIEQVAEQPCVVIGHSLGGATAAALAQRHPDLLVAAVMEDPPLGFRAPPAGDSADTVLEGNSLLDAFRVIRRSAPQLQASGIGVEVLAGVLAATPAATGPTFGELLHPDAVTSMAAALLAVDASVLDPVLNGTVGSFLDLEAPLRVPSLIVCADPAKPDAVADPAIAAHFADISPATEFVVIDGAGHLMHDELTSRDRFCDAALDFVDRLSAAPVSSTP
jgi:pimeloyl-ACP methyl ester carboxylesterase